MRGFTLLMVGIILAALTDFSFAEAGYLSMRPMEGTNGTSNSTEPQEETTENKAAVQWNGTIRPVESDFGFPPTEPLEQSPQKDTKQTELCHGCWSPLEGTRDETE
ncbi:uncharacterized protein LOC112435282 [Maylandia zebra]|uniref:uncharacterized protein LOC112435282 n=1 Tax=Maylandia zebra TaxID=106582 RepID=UPI00403CB3B5